MRTVFIQPRDIALLRGLLESRVMTRRHIALMYFDGREEMARKRLQKLTAAGLVARQEYEHLRSTPFTLSPKGVAELRHRGILQEYPQFEPASLNRRLRVSPLALAHELSVMDVIVSIVRAAKVAGLHIIDCSTWPALNQFATERGVITKPDAFFRIETSRPDGSAVEHSFFVELDRSTESQTVLIGRAKSYVAYYRSGEYALRRGGARTDASRHPFRVLYVLQTAERRNNTIEFLLSQPQPILSQVWFTTLSELKSHPLGPIWIIPRDYRDAVRGSDLDRRRVVQQGYKRSTLRDRFVDGNVPKRSLIEHRRA